MEQAAKLQYELSNFLQDHGLECHPFKVSWYNERVKQGFHLDYHGDTLAFVIISSPSFFEKCFIPFVCKTDTEHNGDLLDQAITTCLKGVLEKFTNHKTTVLHDFEMRPGSRRPKVLVQTAGHVSGAVYFYQKQDIVNSPWPDEKPIYGVCLHPKYGGWFALRAVIVFDHVQVPDMKFCPPKDILETDEKKIDLLRRYNEEWQSWSFRDVIEPIERYSKIQQQYFRTIPSERKPVVEIIRQTRVLPK